MPRQRDYESETCRNATNLSSSYRSSASGTPYGTQESFLPSDVWVKFNNNADLVMRKDGFNHNLIPAFSHWTHHRSGEEIMVVDCQGIFHVPSNTFMLTDPAIHCQDIWRFGATNLEKDGFK